MCVSLSVLKRSFSKQLSYLQAGEQRLPAWPKHPPKTSDQPVSSARGSTQKRQRSGQKQSGGSRQAEQHRGAKGGRQRGCETVGGAQPAGGGCLYMSPYVGQGWGSIRVTGCHMLGAVPASLPAPGSTKPGQKSAEEGRVGVWVQAPVGVRSAKNVALFQMSNEMLLLCLI